MADAKKMNERDSKLVQWLGEAHSKESELETALSAHIRLTQKQSYKKRLQQHLTETRDHKRRVASRIKKLAGPGSGPGGVTETAGKALATVKGGVGTARAAVTEQPETHLRNAQEELREEHVEIAIYSRLEALAREVGDSETAQLAKSIRRDEERMAKFLQAELGRLVKDFVRAEIPRDQRATSTRRRSRSRRRGTSTASRNGRARSAVRSGSSARGRSSASRSQAASRRSSSSR